ncbi:MAG: DUF501 domain-containing protein, partial [Actinomycetota bacterium]
GPHRRDHLLDHELTDPVGGAVGALDMAADTPDRDRVTALLGRVPQGRYEVAVRRSDGWPVVLRNEPLLHSGRPMPTRYWLIDRALNRAIGRLEATGAVDRVEAIIPADELAAAHAAYAAERDARIPADHIGHRPSGGVGGTRIGVKCLHAHYANFLAGAADPVGRWVDDRLRETGDHFDPTVPASVEPSSH